MFDGALNMNTNPLPNHVTSNGVVNALEIGGFKVLKVSINEIYKILIKAGYRKSDCENGLMNESFYKYHKKECFMIDQCKIFHNEVI